ncbi:ATP-binding cassette domain-containing protein [Nocardia fluminea]|uniref:ATP-binding cassette domain-containing protein n=1 Tax=Nocardia fluminea TaxID=134984 RepID=UPI00340C915A
MTAELCCLTVRVDTTRWSETVLEEVDLVVPAGQITAVLGGPGAGKSMAASALAGRLPATVQSRGQVLIDGEVADDQRWPALRDRVVGYVPQEGVTAFGTQKTVGAPISFLMLRPDARRGRCG